MKKTTKSHAESWPLPLGRAPEGFYPGSNVYSASSTQAVLPGEQQRKSLKILNQVQNDSTYFNNDGFTLVELLVVVLIIGILAAVALPQYQAAVDKSRYASMFPYARALYQAKEVYYMANAEEASSLRDLDVTFPENTPLNESGWPVIGWMTLDNIPVAYYLDREGNRIASYGIYSERATGEVKGVPLAGKTICYTYEKHRERAKKICKSLGGTLVAESNCAKYQGRPCDTYVLP